MRFLLVLFLLIAILASSGIASSTLPTQVQASAAVSTPPSTAEEFNRLRQEGNDAVYNMDYKFAQERFQRMVKLLPDHPAGYIYLANNMWLEWLNANRRLSTSLYSGGSFYNQDADKEDAFDKNRDNKFQHLITKAIQLISKPLSASGNVTKTNMCSNLLFLQKTVI